MGDAPVQGPFARAGLYAVAVSEHVVIAVMSDTHGFYDPLLDDLLAGVAAIVHAGDIGSGVYERLLQHAPVTAVLGNTDWPEVLPGVPHEVLATICGVRFLVGHIRERLLREHDLRRERIDALVSGHSHRPSAEWQDGVLLLNPGSAGRARFGLPRTVALVEVVRGRLEPRIVTLA